MTTVIHEAVIDLSPARVWPVLSDFAGFLLWQGIPGRIEGEGIGMIRHMETPEMGCWAERLDVADASALRYGYSLVYGTPIGMATYVARVEAQPEGAGGTRLRWQGNFEAADGQDPDAVAAALQGAYASMTDGIAREAAARGDPEA